MSIQSPSEKVSTLIRKEFAPNGSKFFAFKSRPPFRKETEYY